jgi:dTDP-4-dehydrorhamnose reductase
MGCSATILLTGKNGQVGFELQRALAPLGEIVAVDHADCDLAQPDAIRRLVKEVEPQIIVNPAAYTAVDKAEAEPALAQAINGVAPGLFGEEAKRLDALVVHYSTDYVFDGTKTGPYTEDDAPNPLNVYGRTKLAGEQALIASGAKHLIFRTSWVFGAHGGNFAKTMLRLAAERESLKIVADQFGAPTSAALIADVTAQILGQYLRCRPASADFAYGLYHLTAGSRTSWHEYAQEVVRLARTAGKPLKLGPEDIQAITTADYPLPARRPANSCLDTTKLRNTFGLVLPDWRQGLRHVMIQLLSDR